jgi:hypothetical protein
MRLLTVLAVTATLALPAEAASSPNREIVKREVAALKATLTCPLTRPNRSVPPGSTAGSEFHGNGEIWVGLWTANVVVWDRHEDGSIHAKFGWWRGVPGQLRIEGRRLDAPAPPLQAHIPSGYGDQGFQATGLIFPTEGCWEVTGRVGHASLTFVTLVLAA